MKRFLGLLAVTATALPLVACDTQSGPYMQESRPPASTSSQAPPSVPVAYVALGDSFASMSSADVLDDSSPRAAYCMRSADSYPHIVAAQLPATLVDATCQGATAQDVLQTYQSDEGEILGQIESLNMDTQLVTLTIGGNDVSFGAPSGCDPREFAPGGDDGDASNASQGWLLPELQQEDSCIAEARAANDEALTELPTKLDQVYAAIGERAPNAVVIATGYLPVVLAGDTCDYANQLLPSDLQWFQETTDALNAAVEQSAREHGAIFALPDDAAQHTACTTPERRWTSIDGTDTGSFPMHPTPAGQKAMAEAVAEAYQSRLSA